MAITSGVGPHAAWLSLDGGTFAITKGSISQQAKRKTSKFGVSIPMKIPGAADALSWIGDNSASISVKARGETSTIFSGEIKEVTFDYIGRMIHVTGQDKSGQLHQNKTSEKWLNKLPSEIVQDLVGRLGLSANITPSKLPAGKKLEQDFVKLSDNVSYAQIIQKLAEFDGAKWFVDGKGVFNYVPFGSAQGSSYSIYVNQDNDPISSDCLSLKVTRNVEAGKTVEVTVKSWHPRQKQVFQKTSTIAGTGGPHIYNFNVPGHLQDHVNQHADSQAKERARHELKVHATVVGDTSISAGMDLKLSGTQFDQSFEIDSVHHEFGMGGYRTSMTARSAKEGRTTGD